MNQVVTKIDLPDLPLYKRGKVRDIYDFNDKLLFVATDRVSAFDYILPQGIPGKGKVLTKISVFWFNYLQDIIKNHLISAKTEDFPEATKKYQTLLEGRSLLVKKTELVPIECVVRGYIIGSGWKEYQENNNVVCGIKLPSGLKLAEILPEPIFTPAIKNDEGHDENVSFAKMQNYIGEELSEKLRELSLKIYLKAQKYALEKGIIIADTKFEFGLLNNEIILIDEVLTPDSSRFWPEETYKVGTSPISFDKQIVRDYLENSGWDKTPPIPSLPTEIIEKTTKEYLRIQNLLIS